MLRYHMRIFDQMRKQVVSLAVLGDEDPQWRPDAFMYGRWGCELAFRFPVVKLRELDATVLEATRNPMALLTLLHRDAQETRGQPAERLQRKVLRYRAMLRQGYRADDVRTLLRLMEHVLRLDPIWARQARTALRQVEEEESGMTTFITSFEEEAQRALVLRQLERKVGPLNQAFRQQINELSAEQVLLLGDALLDFTSLADLVAWLANQEAGTQRVPPPDADAGSTPEPGEP
jgi:hypothetical protein